VGQQNKIIGMNKPFIFILYDGIENSVFDGQVLEPLRKHKAKNNNQKIILISFEPKKIPHKKILAITQDNQIEIAIFKRYPFTCTASLWPAIRIVKKFLRNIPEYKLMARGPHAGWIAIHAAAKNQCTDITIQARGLLAEEFSYTLQKTHLFFLTWLRWCRLYSFKKLEDKIYRNSFQGTSELPITIEAVSPALKEYIITQYQTDPKRITIAQNDLPMPLPHDKKIEWRMAIRTKLGITQHTHVYCYNGSIKAWACPEQVIEFFVKQQKHEQNSFLLVITQEKEAFLTILKKYSIDPSRYFVCHIEHKDVCKYLAASDTGLIFREKNILNWISRPTKVLEYQAAGLDIVHNNTIALLANQNHIFKS
jgi:ribosomal protein L25 (general stress protein Ctc)